MERKFLTKAFREFLPILLALILAASLAYISFFPDLPKIEKVNEQPRQTPSQSFQEPPTSNPQVIMVAPPSPSTNDGISTATGKTVSGILNTLAMITLVFVGGSGLYFLLKYRRSFVKYVFGFAFGFIAIVALFFFVEEAFTLAKFTSRFSIGFWYRTLVEAAIAMPLGLFIAGTAVSKGVSRRRRNTAFMMLGTLAGALMATVTPVFIAFPLFLSLAAYDVYAVKHGPIRRIVDDHGVLDLMVAYEADSWSLGLGDAVFYSMLPSSFLAYTMTHISRFKFYDFSILVGIFIPWVVFVVVAVAVIIGFKKTLNLLEKKRLISGLYIPISSGCGAFGLCILMLQLINYFTWGWFVPLL